MKTWIPATIMAVLLLCAGVRGAESGIPVARIPIIYSTDLTHPYMDPDDHFDLACLFAMGEFDIKGIILDMGELQVKVGEGRPPVEQMMHLTGRKVPYAVGLGRPLRSRDDQVLDDDKKFQGGVELILSVLRSSKEKVVYFSTGSCRDIAVAYNREPKLLKEKLKAVYFNIGIGPNEVQNECNVNYDLASYLRMFESGLPLYWAPCFGKDGFGTYYKADQPTLLNACVPSVRNYFVYALTHSTADPITFLANSEPTSALTGPRNMWCTAPMFHAAGRKIYQRGDSFVALSPAAAQKAGLIDKAVDVFDFVPMRAQVEKGAESKAKLVEPKPGELSAAYVDRTKDRVGTTKAEPDGSPDCDVAILGVPADKSIKNIVLTGPSDGHWEYVETGRFWRLAYDRQGKQFHCYFQFYAAGEHKIQMIYDDGSEQTTLFIVPNVSDFRVELKPAQPNGFVFQTMGKRYPEILAACLKNLLAELGR